MRDRPALSGMSCDSDHPYPAPDDASWIDSMEYGEEHRLKQSMWDRDPSHIWRAIAANMWGADCYEQHLTDVAADPILTTHAIAVAALAYPPEGSDAITALAFNQSGAGHVFATLTKGGQKEARKVVNGMFLDVRKTALMECIAHINHGFTALHLDVGGRFSG
jgi:hypothetical protein